MSEKGPFYRHFTHRSNMLSARRGDTGGKWVKSKYFSILLSIESFVIKKSNGKKREDTNREYFSFSQLQIMMLTKLMIFKTMPDPHITDLLNGSACDACHSIYTLLTQIVFNPCHHTFSHSHNIHQPNNTHHHHHEASHCGDSSCCLSDDVGCK